MLLNLNFRHTTNNALVQVSPKCCKGHTYTTYIYIYMVWNSNLTRPAVFDLGSGTPLNLHKILQNHQGVVKMRRAECMLCKPQELFWVALSN